MNRTQKLERTIDYIKSVFTGDNTGHDWWHIYRVWKTAKTIAEKEGADLYITEMAALLHDLDDWKFNESDEPVKAIAWLKEIGEDDKTTNAIIEIINNVSFKGSGVETPMHGLEGKCVQDADRLDAIGAIGVARSFAYGGHKGHEIYNPDVPPTMHQNFEDYKNKTSHTVNHFYEKLLLLKDRMNTKTGLAMAQARHDYMEAFLKQFYAEWEGES